MNFKLIAIYLLTSTYLLAQNENETFEEGEYLPSPPKTIKAGKNGQYTMNLFNKEGGTYHYNLVDKKNVEIFPDVINSIDSISNGKYIIQMDEMCLILDPSLKIIKSYEHEFTKIENLNFYLSGTDQLWVLDERKFFIPLYEFLGVHPNVTKNLNINLNGRKNESNLFNLVYSSNYDDFKRFPQNKTYILNMKNKKISTKHYDHVEFFGDTIFAYTNLNEKKVEILNPNFEIIKSFIMIQRYNDFLFNHTQFILAKQDNQKWLLLDKDLIKITNLEFDTIFPVNLGEIKVYSGYDREILYEDKIRFDKNHHYIAKLNGKWLYLNHKGTIIFESSQLFKPLENETYMCKDSNGKTTIFKFSGKKPIPYEADSVFLFNGNIFLKHNQKWDLFSTLNNKFIYENIEHFEALKWGLFAFSSEKKWALVNGNNFPEQLIYEFDDYKLGAYKQLIVSKNNKWGVLNLRRNQNKLIYPIIYDYIKVYDQVVYEIHQKGKIELFANTEGSNNKKYDKVYFTLIHEDFGYPFVMHCYQGKTKELVKFKNENLFGM